MNAVLYMQIDANIQIKHPHIYLQDIARLSCSDSKILNRLRVMPVINLKPDAPGRYVMSVMDLVDKIQQKEPDLTVTPLGETDFILTYEKPGSQNLIFRWLKIALVCLITFFGAAFSIMTFNADVDVEKLFQQIYFQGRTPVALLLWKSPILLGWGWVSCFSLIISATGRSQQILHPCRYRCVNMKMM